MANQRGTFAKRNREQKLKDRAREKVERRNARRAETREGKGPQIAWDEAGGAVGTTDPTDPPDPTDPAAVADAPASDGNTDTDG